MQEIKGGISKNFLVPWFDKMYVYMSLRQSDLKQMLDNGYTLHISCLVGGMSL